MDWHTPETACTVTAGMAVDNLGLAVISLPGEMRVVDGKRCFVGGVVMLEAAAKVERGREQN